MDAITRAARDVSSQLDEALRGLLAHTSSHPSPPPLGNISGNFAGAMGRSRSPSPGPSGPTGWMEAHNLQPGTSSGTSVGLLPSPQRQYQPGASPTRFGNFGTNFNHGAASFVLSSQGGSGGRMGPTAITSSSLTNGGIPVTLLHPSMSGFTSQPLVTHSLLPTGNISGNFSVIASPTAAPVGIAFRSDESQPSSAALRFANWPGLGASPGAGIAPPVAQHPQQHLQGAMGSVAAAPPQQQSVQMVPVMLMVPSASSNTAGHAPALPRGMYVPPTQAAGGAGAGVLVPSDLRNTAEGGGVPGEGGGAGGTAFAAGRGGQRQSVGLHDAFAAAAEHHSSNSHREVPNAGNAELEEENEDAGGGSVRSGVVLGGASESSEGAGSVTGADFWQALAGGIDITAPAAAARKRNGGEAGGGGGAGGEGKAEDPMSPDGAQEEAEDAHGERANPSEREPTLRHIDILTLEGRPYTTVDVLKVGMDHARV